MKVNIKKIEISKSGKSLNIYSNNKQKKYYIPIKKMSTEFVEAIFQNNWNVVFLGDEILETAPGWFRAETLLWLEDANGTSIFNVMVSEKIKKPSKPKLLKTGEYKFINPLEWGDEPEENRKFKTDILDSIKTKRPEKIEKSINAKVMKKMEVVSIKPLFEISKNTPKHKLLKLVLKYAEDNSLRIGKIGRKNAVADPTTNCLIKISTFVKRYVKEVE